jgi:hypothetical protein
VGGVCANAGLSTEIRAAGMGAMPEPGRWRHSNRRIVMIGTKLVAVRPRGGYVRSRSGRLSRLHGKCRLGECAIGVALCVGGTKALSSKEGDSQEHEYLAKDLRFGEEDRI